MSQPPRKAPSVPNGSAKKSTAAQPKKARPQRSSSTTKQTKTAEQGYAMGSYDNEPIEETSATPSWVSNGAHSEHQRSPSSPSAGAPSPPAPLAPGANSGEMIAPIPFHLLPMGGVLPQPYPDMSIYGMWTPNTTTQEFMMPPASAPPSLAPQSLHGNQQQQHQSTIARILALQQANNSAHQPSSLNASPVPSSSGSVPGPAIMQMPHAASTGPFAPSAHASMPSMHHHAPQQTSFANSSGQPIDPFRTASPVVNPFAAPVNAPSPTLSATNSAHGVPINPFAAHTPVASTTPSPASTPVIPAAPSNHAAGTDSNPLSLDHLLAMQLQINQTQQSMQQFKPMAHNVPPPLVAPVMAPLPHAHHHPIHSNGNNFNINPSVSNNGQASLWQLQQQFNAAPQSGGRPVQLTVSSDGSLRVANTSPHQESYEATAASARSPLKNSNKNIANNRPNNFHAHHNFGVPAQP